MGTCIDAIKLPQRALKDADRRVAYEVNALDWAQFAIITFSDASRSSKLALQHMQML